MNEQPIQPSLVLSLIGTARLLEGKLDAALGGVGLSLAKFGVLDHLVAAGKPLSLSELADRAGCVRSNMTQLVDRLEAEGLIRRVPAEDDRRVIRAQLTTDGQAKQSICEQVLILVQNEALSSLPESDQASLRWVLRRLG